MTSRLPIHGCGECGIRTLVLEPTRANGHPLDALTWSLRCTNGHRFVPIPGTAIQINIQPGRKGT